MRKSFRIACYIAAVLVGIGIGMTLVAPLVAPSGLSFEERWAPVMQIDGGVKGDRLDVTRPSVKPLRMPVPAGVRVA